MAGTMTYMHRQASRRVEPSRIVPGAAHAVVVMKNHFTEDPNWSDGTGKIAKYARGPDYHDTLRTPLEALASFIRELGDSDTIARVYVDAGAVPERELAVRAGLGWIGRNTMLIHPKQGSHHFLATVLTDLDLTDDAPFRDDRCGSCRRCIDSCPTNAITEDRMVDSRRCISYLTIEYAGEIAGDLQRLTGDWIFGCDVCQDVCPWNTKFAKITEDPLLSLTQERAEEDLAGLISIGAEDFGRRFAATPLDRAGVQGIRRNAQIAAENVRRS